MNSSPFRHIVLPALLASSAGFTLLTWPMTSTDAVQIAAKLPAPVTNWLISSPITEQQKEFSIRYVGLAILSSVAIGLGTAEAMRTRQVRLQRRQTLTDLNREPAATDWNQSLEMTPAIALHPAQVARSEAGEIDADSGDETPSGLDWSALIQAGAEVPQSTLPLPVAQPLLLATHSYQPCRLQVGGQRCLAIQVEGEYYRFYRRRPTLDKAQAVATGLQQQGITPLLTHDDKGYIVWNHEPNAQREITPGSMGLAPI